MTSIYKPCSIASYFLAKQTILEKTLVARKITFLLIFVA